MEFPSGLKRSLSSSSVRVPTMAQIMLPTELPLSTRGSRLLSCSAFITPMWYRPSVAPPDSSSAERPNAWRVSLKKDSFSAVVGRGCFAALASMPSASPSSSAPCCTAASVRAAPVPSALPTAGLPSATHTSCSARTTSLMYSSMSRLVPALRCVYSLRSLMPTRLRSRRLRLNAMMPRTS